MHPTAYTITDHDKEFLFSLKFFKLLPQNTRELLASQFVPIRYAAKESIITQGDTGDAIYFIEEGNCDIIVEKTDGERFSIAERGPAGMVGEMALITDEPRQAHVIAKTEVKVWQLARQRFVELVAKHHDLQEFLTGLVAMRLEKAAHTADRSIGKYQIKHKLGHGAWAVVYQGSHTTLGKKVAIKMLKHQMAMVPEFHERFIQEATIIGNMQHKNIINVFDVEERFNTIFIVMEYLEGVPLDTLLKEDGPLPPAKVVDIFQQVCAGLTYAHERGVVHQDIKPDNLFLMPNGRIKILDFGLACPFGSENFDMEGTIEYMSPEQIDGYPVDARTDIYCLGITAFELLTGKQPFPNDDIGNLMEQHLTTELPDPADFIEGVPPELSATIRTCCKKDHKKRFQSASLASHSLDSLESTARTGCMAKQNMSSLHLFYDDEQKSAVTTMLEEISEQAKANGVRFKLVDFDNFLT
jgi:serine/threonine protein kinase